MATCKRLKLDAYLTLHVKINPKWITDLSLRAESAQFLEENSRASLCDLKSDGGFLETAPKVRSKGKKYVTLFH